MTSETYEILVEDGPKPVEEMPRSIDVQEKKRGVAVFKPGNANKGDTDFGGGRRNRICYIIGKHDAKTVIKKWIDCNPRVVENTTKIGLHKQISNYGDDFKNASYEILGPFDMDGGHGDGVTEMKCPFCSKDGFQQLPKHLENCEHKP